MKVFTILRTLCTPVARIGKVLIAFITLLALIVTPAASAYPAGVTGTGALVSAVDMTSATNIYAGGIFSQAGGSTANNIARYDGYHWHALGSGTNGQVRAIAITGGKVYVGGDFTTAGGSAAAYIAVWNPSTSTWSAFPHSFNGAVYAIEPDGAGNLYIGGSFTSVGGVFHNRVVRYTIANNSLTNMLNGTNGLVQAIAVSGGRVYVGGAFTRVNGFSTAANRVAYWTPASNTWSIMSTGFTNGVTGGLAYALEVDNTGLIWIGGGFTSAGGVAAARVARYNPATNTMSAAAKGFNSDVRALAFDSKINRMYAGGSFTVEMDQSRSVKYIAYWDSGWYPLQTGLSGSALALVADDVIVGGAFATAHLTTVNNITLWNGADFLPLEEGPTPVELVSLTATASAEGMRIDWETAQEVDIAGFNILRSANGGSFEQINAELILPQSAGGLMGGVYQYLDTAVSSGVCYQYQLQVVNTNGSLDLHGPTACCMP